MHLSGLDSFPELKNFSVESCDDVNEDNFLKLWFNFTYGR